MSLRRMFPGGVALHRSFSVEEVLPGAFGHDDDGVIPGNEPSLEMAQEPLIPFHVEGLFGDQDEIRITLGEGCRGGDVAGLTPHQFHEADAHGGAFGFHVGALDRLDGLGDGRVETETLLDEHQIVVDGLGDADHADLELSACNLVGDDLGGLHGAVPADDEEEVDVHPLQGVDHFGDVLVAPGRREDAAAEILDVLDDVRCELEEVVTVARDQALEAVLDADDVPDAVTEMELHDEGADDVVDPGAQTPAGDDGRLDLLRFEVDHVSRAGDFEGHGFERLGRKLFEQTDADVTEDPFVIALEVAYRERGRDLRFTQVLDLEIPFDLPHISASPAAR